MMQHFKNSPLWLIGLFIVFSEATTGIAAVNINGWPQAALVIFVIVYSTVVTAVFFSFLWFKPQNFYPPSEYIDVSPKDFASALSGIPQDMAVAVTRVEGNPNDEDAVFSLMDNLLDEQSKQHLILISKLNNSLDVSDIDESGFSHKYELVTRTKSVSMGIFSPASFLHKLNGTDLVSVSGGRDKILLTNKGMDFVEWLIRHEKDAETFVSTKGGWGKKQSINDVMQEHYSRRNSLS